MCRKGRCREKGPPEEASILGPPAARSRLYDKALPLEFKWSRFQPLHGSPSVFKCTQAVPVNCAVGGGAVARPELPAAAHVRAEALGRLPDIWIHEMR